jgi:hypothetical protein
MKNALSYFCNGHRERPRRLHRELEEVARAAVHGSIERADDTVLEYCSSPQFLEMLRLPEVMRSRKTRAGGRKRGTVRKL